MPDLVQPLTGRFWRAGFLDQSEKLLCPAGAPFGRWHRQGQTALYLSDSPEGCQVALRIYVSPEDPPRGIFEFQVKDAKVVDLRCEHVRKEMGISMEAIHAPWTAHVETGDSPTWVISDRLRDLKAQGVVSPSRSQPELAHLTLFTWNAADAPKVARVGNPLPFDPHYGLA
jgi:RES domain-containing protein